MKSFPTLSRNKTSNEHTGCCALCWEHRATLEAAGRKQVQVSISGVSNGRLAKQVGWGVAARSGQVALSQVTRRGRGCSYQMNDLDERLGRENSTYDRQHV